LARAGIKNSVLAVGCLLIVAAFVGLRPSRADEFNLPEPQRAARETGPPRFPHKQEKHRTVDCATCHLGAKRNATASDHPVAKDFPHAACINCHQNFAAEFFRYAVGGSNRFCGICHMPGRTTASPESLRTDFTSPQMKNYTEFEDVFGHRAHQQAVKPYVHITPVRSGPQAGYGSQFSVGARPLCTSCHAPIRNAPVEAKDMQTQMDHPTCFVCHGGVSSKLRTASELSQFPYENDCRGCHALIDGKSGPGRHELFGQIKKFRHYIDHDIDIRPKKKPWNPPAARDYLCSDCHSPIAETMTLNAITLPQAGYCNQCHQSRKPGLPDQLSAQDLNKLGKRP
jgi:Cytochrome c7 and related cytochrome c